MFTSSCLLLLLIASVKADSCSKGLLPISQLKSDLLCGYDNTLPPLVNHNSSIQLVIKILLKYFNFDIHENAFTVDTWLYLFWLDEHLKWKPSEYASIKSLHLRHSDIWMPDLSVYNKREQGGDQNVVESVVCTITFQGQVVCVPSVRISSICIPDLTKYPYDSHNCTIRLGSWTHSGEELDIRVADTPVTKDDMVANGEWTLESVQVYKSPGIYDCCPNNTYPTIYFSFIIKRVPGAHAATVVLPILALIIITLTSLWISPDHPQRLDICFVNLICQFLNAQYVSYLLPLNGENIPLIILFARDSLLLCTFTVVFSVILKNMVENDQPAPGWMSQIVSLITGCSPGRLIFSSDTSFRVLQKSQSEDGAAIIGTSEDNKQNKDWLLFAKILDRLLFSIYVIVYICMMIAFIP